MQLFNDHVDSHNSQLASTATGMAVSLVVANPRLKDLTPNTPHQLSAVLTCAHAFGTGEQHCAYYFVQTCHLNPATGFPQNVTEINGSQGLIHFLINSLNSYKIGMFHIRSRQDQRWRLRNPLDMTQPRYEPQEDWLIGTFAEQGERSAFREIHYQGCVVSFLPLQPGKEGLYFTMDYPSREHRPLYSTHHPPPIL